ncbi:MAG: ComEC/Rec2 family competence protein [Candidatus Roizmanbacteria bacterium]|nr:MAG: ComEC/Rec2 family competence protein [Candidatus Roizmanbacteria bacterium]
MPDITIVTSVINNYIPEPQASLLNGILFGVPLSKSGRLYEQLKILGLLHIIVLSGLNITLLASFVSFLTAFFSKQLSLLITILTVILFIAFVGPQAPIVRAGFMGILTFVAILLGRRTIAIYSLLISILFIAVFWPAWLKSISLYLSYGATLGIILFAGSESKTNFLIQDLRITLSAQLFTAPLILIYFKQFSLIAPLSNLFVSFIIPPLMMFGFATVILGKINFYLGLPFAYICYGLLTYIVLVGELLSKLPYIFFQF